MSKKSTSVSIDDDLHDRLQEQGDLNVSGLFNDFLRDYFATGSVFGLEKRHDRLETKIENKQNEIERLKEERNTVKSHLDQRRAKRDMEMEEVLEILSGMAPEQISRHNDAIQRKSHQIGVPPEKLADKLLKRVQSESEFEFDRSSSN